MHRGLVFAGLFLVSATLVGCNSEGSPNSGSATPAPDASKQAAAQMPPPPGTKPAAPK
jgi:hypothetical protein